MSLNTPLMFATGNDTTGTPWAFFNKLNTQWHFGCDLAALSTNRKVDVYFGPDHPDPARRDCLTVDWPTDKTNWLNPPYSDCMTFMAKAYEQQQRGATTVALVASRTDTKWWHKFVWDQTTRNFYPGISVQFVKGRLKFEGHKNSAPFPSAVVVFKGTNLWGV